MKKTEKGAPVSAMALFVLVLLCILFLVTMGSGLYASLVAGGSRNNAGRASLSYVARKLAAADETGAVAVREGPEGDLLVLAEPLAASGYETYIYLYQGRLREEYRPAGSSPAPETAQAVAATDAFAVTLEPGGLVRVVTGEGETQIYLHSEGAVQ